MSDYPIGTVAVATVKNVKNVKVLRGDVKGKTAWLFSPVPDLGLKGNTASDVDVRDIVVTDDSVPSPERAAYDVSNMNATQLEAALTELLGENEEDGGDYYDDYTGLNGFYHTLAGTDYRGDVSAVKYTVSTTTNGVLTITVPALGTFTAIEKKTEYEAETGDANVDVVFKFNNRYFQKHGNLDSYEGGYFDGRLTEVKPVERMVTFWERA